MLAERFTAGGSTATRTRSRGALDVRMEIRLWLFMNNGVGASAVFLYPICFVIRGSLEYQPEVKKLAQGDIEDIISRRHDRCF